MQDKEVIDFLFNKDEHSYEKCKVDGCVICRVEDDLDCAEEW